MRLFRLSLLLASPLLFGLLTPPLRADLEFTGLIAMKGNTLFSLADFAAGTRSPWIGLRDEFAGYTLSAYDPKTDVLTVTKNGVKTELHLNVPKAQNASLEVRGAMTLTAGAQIDVERATLVFEEETRFPLQNGVTVAITPHRLPDGSLLFEARFERPRPDGTIEVLGAPTVSVLPDKPFSIQLVDPAHPGNNFGFSFTPTVTNSAAVPTSAAPSAVPPGARPLTPATK